MADRFHPETRDRQRTMLRTAMGPAIASALADPAVIEVMVNPETLPALRPLDSFSFALALMR